MVGRMVGRTWPKRQLHKLSAREAETITEPGRHSPWGHRFGLVEETMIPGMFLEKAEIGVQALLFALGH